MTDEIHTGAYAPVRVRDDYTTNKNFWIRLRSFTKDVQPVDDAGHEEREMILEMCDRKIGEL
jgi:hypothetical protein